MWIKVMWILLSRQVSLYVSFLNCYDVKNILAKVLYCKTYLLYFLVLLVAVSPLTGVIERVETLGGSISI